MTRKTTRSRSGDGPQYRSLRTRVTLWSGSKDSIRYGPADRSMVGSTPLSVLNPVFQKSAMRLERGLVVGFVGGADPRCGGQPGVGRHDVRRYEPADQRLPVGKGRAVGERDVVAVGGARHRRHLVPTGGGDGLEHRHGRSGVVNGRGDTVVGHPRQVEVVAPDGLAVIPHGGRVERVLHDQRLVARLRDRDEVGIDDRVRVVVELRDGRLHRVDDLLVPRPAVVSGADVVGAERVGQPDGDRPPFPAALVAGSSARVEPAVALLPPPEHAEARSRPTDPIQRHA